MNGESADFVVKTSRAMWILFGAPFPLIAGLAASAAITSERFNGFWFPAIALGLFSLVHLSWLGTARLALTADEVRYRALFVHLELKLSKIVSARFEFGPKAFGPTQRLVLKMRGDGPCNVVTINAGLFDKRRLKQWIVNLNDRLIDNASSRQLLHKGE